MSSARPAAWKRGASTAVRRSSPYSPHRVMTFARIIGMRSPAGEPIPSTGRPSPSTTIAGRLHETVRRPGAGLFFEPAILANRLSWSLRKKPPTYLREPHRLVRVLVIVTMRPLASTTVRWVVSPGWVFSSSGTPAAVPAAGGASSAVGSSVGLGSGVGVGSGDGEGEGDGDDDVEGDGEGSGSLVVEGDGEGLGFFVLVGEGLGFFVFE